VFEADLPHAPRPEDVPIELTPIVAAFAAKQLPALQKAIEAHDRAGFDAAFAEAARAYNACHEAAKKAFIEVPSRAGAAVPDLSAPAVAAPAGGTR